MSEGGTEQREEIVFRGIGVSPGVVVGPAHLLTQDADRVVERDITEEEIPREIIRMEEALIATRRQLHDIQERVSEALGRDNASIFDAHLLVVDDPAFLEEVIRGIKGERKNVDVVLQAVAERYATALSKVDDDYLRERASDVRDVARRILRNLSGQTPASLSDLEDICIVVANA